MFSHVLRRAVAGSDRPEPGRLNSTGVDKPDPPAVSSECPRRMIQKEVVSCGDGEVTAAVLLSGELSNVAVTLTLLNGMAYVLNMPDGWPV